MVVDVRSLKHGEHEVPGTPHETLPLTHYDKIRRIRPKFWDYLAQDLTTLRRGPELNITWLQNVGLAASNSFGVSGITTYSFLPNFASMTWDTAQNWIAAMNAAEYLGFDDWRLPSVSPVNGTTFDYSSSTAGNTDIGFNISAPGTVFSGSTASELAYMFYNNLGAVAQFSPTGAVQSNYGALSSGLFQNLSFGAYWTDTELIPLVAWTFNTYTGRQDGSLKSKQNFVWAVRDGDVAAPIPEPDTLALILAGLGLVGWTVKRGRGGRASTRHADVS